MIIINSFLVAPSTMPEQLFFDMNGNLNNTGSHAGVTSTLTGTSPNESQIAYVSALAGATEGQALNIIRGGFNLNGTESLAVGDVSWEFGCFINPLYQSYSLLGKCDSGYTRGWNIVNYYGKLYVGMIGGSNTNSQGTFIMPSNVVSKLKVVYDANAHTVKYYINDVLAATHTGITLTGYSGDLLRYAGWNNPIGTTVHHYVDDMYFKLT